MTSDIMDLSAQESIFDSLGPRTRILQQTYLLGSELTDHPAQAVRKRLQCSEGALLVLVAPRSVQERPNQPSRNSGPFRQIFIFLSSSPLPLLPFVARASDSVHASLTPFAFSSLFLCHKGGSDSSPSCLCPYLSLFPGELLST